mmetsp:Transcript_17001/g.47647  ORF Transcript_17001/g.47647 Transcript_17001/m.47647 type:complete len:438 (-) Transcript_17001:101-1414(-)
MARLHLLALLVAPAAGLDNGAPRSRTPPLGWSSWVALGPGWPGPDAQPPKFDYCDAASVKASADAFFDVGLYAAGYRHFHLDDCWADSQRNGSGFLQAHRQRFPDGMEPVAEYVRAKGLTFGLYTGAGKYTCAGSIPGSKDHFEEDAALFAEWGVDWIKMDWCHTVGMDAEETYAKMAEALNRTGRAIHLNLCEWGRHEPWRWAPKVAQSFRTSVNHNGEWWSTKSLIRNRTLAVPSEMGGGPYAWNDMDSLQTGNSGQAALAAGIQAKMTPTEYRTEFSMWAILASPMLVTTPLLDCATGTCRPSITDLQRQILLNTEVIDINQDVTPAGRLLWPAAFDTPGLKIYGRLLSDGSVAVALYNPEDRARQGFVDFSLLGWPRGTAAAVRDLWAHLDLGLATDRFPPAGRNASVEAHGTAVYRLTRPVGSPSAAEELLV